MWKNVFISIAILLFASSSDSAVLQCRWIGTLLDQCIPYNMTPITMPNEAITVYGRAANFVNSVSDNLMFQNFYLKYVPTNIFKIFTNVRWFSINNCSTTGLVTDSFINCGIMETILIEGGSIKYVSEGFAQSCVNLKNLLLRNDNIEVIDKNALRGLSNLQLLDLSKNKISCVPADFFQPTLIIKDIYLQYNRIRGVDRLLFQNLRNLSTANLSSNLISYLPSFYLYSAAIKTTGLHFYDNPIYAIKTDFCTTFNNRPSNTYDVIYLKDPTYVIGIPCILPGNPLSIVSKDDCNAVKTYMQNCFSNATAAMSDSYPCDSNVFCFSGSLMNKLMDLLRYLSL